jgi:hypothetical protein
MAWLLSPLGISLLNIGVGHNVAEIILTENAGIFQRYTSRVGPGF